MEKPIAITREPTAARRNLPARNCWCPSARNLIGQHINANTLPNPHGTDATISVVTDIDHTVTAGRSRCWLILDGWARWPIPTTEHAITITTTDAPTTLGARTREPLHHEGPLPLDTAAALIREYETSYRLAAAAIPATAGSTARTRAAFTPRPPATPTTAASFYTQGRIRRVPTTGRWAADQGWAGTTRQLGEYDTPDQAAAHITAAITASWDTLHTWLIAHVAGNWTLVRDLKVSIDVQDRLTVRDAATLAGIEEHTLTAYLSRHQAPAATGKDAAGRDYWDRTVILAWLETRPRKGQRPAGQ